MNASHSSLCLVSITPAFCPRRKYKKKQRGRKKKILLWQVTLIRGFRLEDIVLQTEMNTQLRERVNRTRSQPRPQRSCATFVTQMKRVSLSLSLSLSVSLTLSPSLPLSQHLHLSMHLSVLSSCPPTMYTASVVAHFERKGDV